MGKMVPDQNLVRFTWNLHTSQFEGAEYESDMGDLIRYCTIYLIEIH